LLLWTEIGTRVMNVNARAVETVHKDLLLTRYDSMPSGV
jgi:hypothetical protein